MFALIASTVLSATPVAHAYAPTEVANKTFACGPWEISFGPGGQTATLTKLPRKKDAKGKRVDVGWGNRGIDAVIDDHDFDVLGTDHYELDGERCR